MSEYNIQMNKYNALNAGYDQLYPQPMKHANTHAKDGNDPITPSMIGTYNKTEINTLLQNKAPAGYGLGTNAKFLTSADDANDIWQSGWYRYDSGNIPQNGITLSYLHVMRVDGYSSGVFVQTVYGLTDSVSYQICPVARRFMYGTKITPWEYINPPMLLGVEYRTTERYLGKPVYVKMVDFGALPNNTIKDVSAGISSDVLLYGFIDLAKSYFGPASVSRTNFNPMHENIDQIWFRLGDIRIKTNIDMSGYVAYICVKYTKNTD